MTDTPVAGGRFGRLRRFVVWLLIVFAVFGGGLALGAVTRDSTVHRYQGSGAGRPGPIALPTVTLTQADTGKTVRLPIGATLIVDFHLSTTYNWSPAHAENATVLSTAGVDRLVGAGLGSTDLTSIGTPRCRQAAQPCLAPLLQWQVHVVVSG